MGLFGKSGSALGAGEFERHQRRGGNGSRARARRWREIAAMLAPLGRWRAALAMLAPLGRWRAALAMLAPLGRRRAALAMLAAPRRPGAGGRLPPC